MERIDSRVVYENAWMTVREDRVRRVDGSAGVYGVVDKPDFAVVLPLTDDGRFVLVEQLRYPIGRRAWEFPQGGWPAGRTGTAEELARTELAEETGLRASSVVHIGHLFAAYGFCSQGFDVFLATGLTPGDHAREVTELDMRQDVVDRHELAVMLRDGRLVDAPSVAALALLDLLG